MMLSVYGESQFSFMAADRGDAKLSPLLPTLTSLQELEASLDLRT